MTAVCAERSVTRVAAFDVDGTLIRGQSQVYFARLLARRGLIRPQTLLLIGCWFLLMRLGFRIDQQKVQRRAIGSLAGLPQPEMERLLDLCVEQNLLPAVRPGALAEIERLRAEGCRVVLVSAAPRPIVARLAERLGLQDVVATEIAPAVDGLFSGRVEGDCVLGGEKLSRLFGYADAAFGRWELLAAYGDQHTDGPILAAARRPVAVSPNPRLARLALARGWPVLVW